MAPMIFQAFGMPISAIGLMLGAIENMKFFLQTGFKDSASLADGGISFKPKGSARTTGLHQPGGQSLAHMHLEIAWQEGARGEIPLFHL